MKHAGRLARHQYNQLPERATYEQCQRIWALMKLSGLEPVWADRLPYAQAVTLITNLELLRQHAQGAAPKQ